MNRKIYISTNFNFLLPILVIAAVIGTGCATSQKTTSVPTEAQARPPLEKPPASQKTGTSMVPQTGPSQQRQAQGQTSEKSAAAQLETAREKLQVSRETAKRVQAEFENLKQSGQASPEVTKDYETYLSRIKSLVVQNRDVVEKFEAAAVSNAGFAAREAAREDSMDTVQLDRRLDQSLSEFDEMLLREMDKIQAQSQRKMTSLAEEAAAAAERLREKGIDVGGADGEEESLPQANTANEDPDQGEAPESEAKEATGETDGQRRGSGEGRMAAAEKGMSGSEQAKTDTAGDAGGTRSNDRRRNYSEKDDDIVARQLREAAEKESDPELKEKLWKEYEDYKRDAGQ